MKAINESDLRNRLDSESTKRLDSYQAHLLQGSDHYFRDKHVLRRISEYALPGKQEWLQGEFDYLSNLTNSEGRHYCRSYGEYDWLQDQFDHFKLPEKPSFRWNQNYQKAVEIVKARYAGANLRMVNYSCDEDVYDAVTDWSTATGWTRIVTGKQRKEQVLGGICSSLLERETRARSDGSFNVPIICATRTQASGAYYHVSGERTYNFKQKMRAVFMVDVYTVASESRFGKPMNEWISDYKYSAIGKDFRWIKLWIDKQRDNNMSWISLDYSKYDSTIPGWLIKSAFEVLAAAFRVYDEKLLWVLCEDFVNKNIVVGDEVFFTNHGNPSGSRLTALVNGICNEIITETWMQKFGITHASYNIMGDDNLIFLQRHVDEDFIEQVASYISHNFGVVVNTAKTEFDNVSVSPEYLSNTWMWTGPCRPVGELLERLFFPERWRDYGKGELQEVMQAGDLTPDHIIFSYCQMYPNIMNKFMDVGRFRADFTRGNTPIKWTAEQARSIPYVMRTYMESKGLIVKT